MTDIPADYRGWWRIIDTGTWVNDYLDDIGCPWRIRTQAAMGCFVESLLC